MPYCNRNTDHIGRENTLLLFRIAMALEDEPPASRVSREGDTQPCPPSSQNSADNTSSKESSGDEPNERVRDPKEDEILEACCRRDIAALQSLALSTGGFITDELRQQACE